MAKKRHTNVPASYLTLLKDNKILLLRRYNTGFEDGNYSMVSGHVDPQETFTQCMVREAKEEAGIDVNSNDLEMVHMMHRMSTDHEERVDVFFITKKWEGEIVNKEPHKCDDLSWFDIDNLPKNTIPYIKKVLNKIKNKEFYSEHGWDKK